MWFMMAVVDVVAVAVPWYKSLPLLLPFFPAHIYTLYFPPSFSVALLSVLYYKRTKVEYVFANLTLLGGLEDLGYVMWGAFVLPHPQKRNCYKYNGARVYRLLACANLSSGAEPLGQHVVVGIV